MKDFILNFFRSKSNESSKRLIAFMFSTALIVVLALFCIAVVLLLYRGKPVKEMKEVVEQIITTFAYLIASALCMNTVENISGIFKKDK